MHSLPTGLAFNPAIDRTTVASSFIAPGRFLQHLVGVPGVAQVEAVLPMK